MATYNLPAVSYTRIQEPTAPGEWTSAQRLDDLAMSLEVPVRNVEISAMKSIPDPWAQPLMFGQALTDEDHELHESVVPQWRGMLALFGLQAYYADVYQLKIVAMNLAEVGQGNERFRAVLKTLLPTATLGGGANWEKLGAVTFTALGTDDFETGQTTALGIFSPISLVAPGKSAAQLSCAGVPWLKHGLVDPIACEDVPLEQFAALAAFLQRLLQHFENEDTSLRHDGVLTRFTDQIAAFGRLCRDKAGEGQRTGQANFGAPRHSVPAMLYEALRYCPEPRPKPIETGIRLREVRYSAADPIFAGAVLVDSALAERTLGKAPENVCVWESYTLRQLESPHVLAEARRRAADAGVLLLTPDDIFTEKLVQFETGTEVPAHPEGFRNRALPLSPMVLLLLSAEEIRNRLSIADRGDRFEVSLELDIQRQERLTVERHMMTRAYPKDEVLKIEGQNDLALWPDFASDDWRWTFLRFQYTALELGVRFALSGRSFAELLAAQGRQASERVRAAFDWSASGALIAEAQNGWLADKLDSAITDTGETIIHRVRFADDDDLVGEQQLLPYGADAVFLSSPPVRDEKRKPAGCVLVRRQPVSQGQDDIRISVDFGTTNTVVYRTRGGGSEPMLFANRVVHPIWVGSLEKMRTELAPEYTDFFPLHDQPLPFPTVAKRRFFKSGVPEALQAMGGASMEAGVSDNIFFMPKTDKTVTALEQTDSRDLVFQLKWNPEPKMRQMVERFMRQIMMMATAEAVADGVLPQNIEWRFSYPQAFTYDQMQSFRQSLDGAWSHLFARHFESLGIAPTPRIALETEGAAALRYFTAEDGQHGGKAGRMILMLDIGGGTTELALYKDRRTLWRSSVKVAGGRFFTAFIANNLELLKKLELAPIAAYIKGQSDAAGKTDARSEAGAGGRTRGPSARDTVELVVSNREFETKFARLYNALRGAQEGEALQICAGVALAGMIYYAGIAARAMIERGEELRPETISDLTVTFAGRGSSVFKFFGPASESRSLLAGLCRLFRAAALPAGQAAAAEEPTGATPARTQGPPARVTALFSDLPKHEVAEGLLAKRRPVEEEPAHRLLPLGLKVAYRSGAEAAALPPTADVSDVPAGSTPTEVDLDEFDLFLKTLAAESGLSIGIDHAGGDARRTIGNRVWDRLSEAMLEARRGEEPEDMPETEEVEPPFISALRALIDMLSAPVAERDKLVKVRKLEPRR